MSKLYRVAMLEPAVIPGTITPLTICDPYNRVEHKGIELDESPKGISITKGIFTELIPWGNVRFASYRRPVDPITKGRTDAP